MHVASRFASTVLSVVWGSFVGRVFYVPLLCFRWCFWKRFPRFPRYTRYPRSGFLLLVVLLEACFAFSALSAFRFSASGRASGSVFRVLRVICVPERYGVLLSLCAFSLLTGITYGAEAGAEAQKWRFRRQRNMPGALSPRSPSWNWW